MLKVREFVTFLRERKSPGKTCLVIRFGRCFDKLCLLATSSAPGVFMLREPLCAIPGSIPTAYTFPGYSQESS